MNKTRAAIRTVCLQLENPPASTLYALIFVGICALKWISDYRKQAKVPGVGYDSFPLLRQWRAAFRFMMNPRKLIVEGYDKYKDGYFRFSTPQYEYVVVSEISRINEILAAPESSLSFIDSSNEAFQIPWTMGMGVAYNHYHTPIVRTKLTQKIQNLVPILFPEVSATFDRLVGASPVCLYDINVQAIARVSSKAFVGDLLCHNEEYLNNAIGYAESVLVSAEMIRIFPDWMKPALMTLTPIARQKKIAAKFLYPLIKERFALEEGDSKKAAKPDDMLQWLIDAAPPSERTLERLSEIVMALNVASLHTTTMTVTNILYRLASEPPYYTEELRKEIAENLTADGSLDKTKIGKLKKMDSFMRERVVELLILVWKDYRFKDGTVIPRGTVLAVPSYCLHRDPAVYTKPRDFDGFRFSRPREVAADGGKTNENIKHQMVSTDINYLAFGHGKHACPGRFFAVNEMKMILAHILPNYDLRLAFGTAPKETFLGTLGVPDSKLKVLMRARQ
ncbi:hypothetical protein G7Y89_g11385 [Cudoniella acicularis]|uniref:Cytochrome P450 n=1 Tax=Cudoniella acicularis TaxID=354080 RepID=A0A8H4VXW7_9HELO|nr:hypothetical protein G7Y89_g11385 [Cudoniella acicularis]